MKITSVPDNTQYRSIANNEHGVPYYKSNKGTIVGAIWAVPAAAFYLASKSDKFTKGIEEDMLKNGKIEDLAVYRKVIESYKKLAVPFAIIAGACTLGAGMIYDKIRNDKARRAATDIARNQYTTVYANGGEVGTSPTGAPYYKTTNKIKYGVISGAVCGLIATGMESYAKKGFSVINLLGNVGSFIIGGLIMSAIAQKATNKATEKSTYSANV